MTGRPKIGETSPTIVEPARAGRQGSIESFLL